MRIKTAVFAPVELRLCPFCGKSAVLHYDQHTEEYYVLCSKCRVRTRKEQYKQDAIGAWNRRT